MHIPVMNQAALMGEFVGEFNGRDFEDESEVENLGGWEGSVGEGEGGVSSRGNGGAIRDRPVKVIPCPRCQSMNTKFCYYNNYSVNQPRHFCRNCQRYWTVGGTLRNVPVGGGSRKKTRPRSRNDAYLVRGGGLESPPASNSSDMTSGLFGTSSCMQQLSMLPTTLGGMGFSPFPSSASQLPFLSGFGPGSLLPQMLPKSPPISGLQEVPDLRSFYDLPQVPQVPQLPPANSAPMMLPNPGFFLPDLQSAGAHDDVHASVMTKAGMWSSPAQQLQVVTGGRMPSAGPAGGWDERPLGERANSLTAQQFCHLSGYEPEPEALRTDPIGSTPMNSKLAALQAGFWENDRLVPHVTTSNSWEEGPNSRNFSPNSSTIEEERCPPRHCFEYQEDVISQPWVGLQASDIPQF